MNVIFILVDSLNKHCLRTYNPDTVCESPAFEAFAGRSFVFENHFVGSLPCMPARREIFAGRKDFLWRPWGPLEVFDPRLPRVVKAADLNTGIVTDHYHYWEEQANGYVQGFASTLFIRGHETDFWKLPESGPVPRWVEKITEYRSAEHMRQYYSNVKDFRSEADYFAPKVFQGAIDWLDANADKGDFYLHVESFDVHEPFDVPEPYASMYAAAGADKNDYNIWPPYQVYADLEAFMAQTTPEELAFLKAQYLGKITMVDRWLGRLMRKIDAMDLWKDTMVILTTDHGHDLGERGAFGKQFPHYDSHTNVPLAIWHPRHPGCGKRVSALTQTVDLFATVIDAAGGAIPEANRHSRSLLPLLERGNGAGPREAALYGTFGQGACVTDGEWTLLKAPVEDRPLYIYSTMINQPLIVDNPIDGRVGRIPDPPVDQGYFDPSVELPMWKLPIRIDPRTHENFLFHRTEDPEQKNNLWDSEPRQRRRMLDLLHDLMDDEGHPEEQLHRLGLTDVAPET